MDKRNSYYRLKEMLEEYKGKTLSIHELKTLISVNLGCGDKTISQHLRSMGMTGLIEDIGDCKFKIL